VTQQILSNSDLLISPCSQRGNIFLQGMISCSLCTKP